MPQPTTVHLQCDMESTCDEPIAMIDDKGWIYCEYHGLMRRDSRRCRKLRPHELRRLQRGEQVTRY
jgi:hypothetical protein